MQRLPFVAEWKGAHSGVNEPRCLVITDEKSWAHLWRTVQAIRTPIPPVPEVDFGRHMVLAAFMGRKPTSGFAIQITEVVARNNEALAFVKETAPPPNAIVLQVITQPFHIVVCRAESGRCGSLRPSRAVMQEQP